MAHKLTKTLANGAVELRCVQYGHIASITKVPDGQCMEGMYLITWTNDNLGWGPMWKCSMKAVEFIALAYVYELEASGY